MNGKVSPVLQRLLERELSPGERIVWSATPSILKWWGFYFVVVLLAVAALLEWKVWSLMSHLFRVMPSPEVPLMEGIFILTIILTVLIPVALWWSTRRILFVVTDRRAIIIQALCGCRTKSFTGEQLVRVARTENRHGSGSISFGYNWAFWGISDTRAVAQILREVYESRLKMSGFP